MKKKLILILIIFIFLPSIVFAVVSTETPTINKSTSSTIDDQSIKKLKENIANKVEEIRKKNNRIISGNIKEIKDDSFKIESDKTYLIKIQDTGLTTFYKITSGQQKEINKKDFNVGDYVIVSGLIDGSTITANSIFKDEQYLIVSGKIVEINRDNYYLKLVTSAKINYLINIETYTKQYLLNIKILEKERIGFSKLKEGDFVHVVIKINERKDKNEYSAERLLVIPQEYFLK